MRRAIAAVANGQGSREELRHAAAALVGELRRHREPPEQVLVQIKEILADVGLRPTYAHSSDGAPAGLQATLYRDVIAWSIRSYYDGRDGDGKAQDGIES